MQRLRSASFGFSIVETMVALVILVFGLGAAYEQFYNLKQVSAAHETAVTARLLAQGELERLRACTRASLLAAPPMRVPQPIPNHLRFIYLPTVTPREGGLVEIEVKVGWDTPSDRGFADGKSVVVRGWQGS